MAPPEPEAGLAWEAGSCESESGMRVSWVPVSFTEVFPRLAAGSCGLGGGGADLADLEGREA